VNFLIDTNVLIAVEPVRVDDAETGLDLGAEFLALCATGGHGVFRHPQSTSDMTRDKDPERLALRLRLATKYQALGHPPAPPPEMVKVVGTPSPDSHNVVDHALLAAVMADAVDFLVTEDNGIHRKARQLGLSHRVLHVADAIQTLQSLYVRLPQPPPAVERVKAHALRSDDPIFDSLREDYAPAFDAWFTKAKRDQRDAYVIGLDHPPYAGVCLLKPEPVNEYGFAGVTLKISTFKVAANHSGFRFGELLLKTVFEHAAAENFDGIYVTVFSKHEELIALFQDFGFDLTPHLSQMGELVLYKRLRWTAQQYRDADDLAFHVRYGPPSLKMGTAGTFLVPVQPRWHKVLFPEVEDQYELVSGTNAFGNSIRKAYLCNSPSRQVQPGSTLLFYRSDDRREVAVVGVCEAAYVSESADEISQLVGKRTVYNYEEIQALARKPTLVLLFRQARVLRTDPIGIHDMIDKGVLLRAPQSIVSVRTDEGTTWLRQLLSA
jgi:L-amino acid N-acyltransferase YncA